MKKGSYFGRSPATYTSLPCPLPALEHAASKNNKRGRERENNAKVHGQWDKSECLRMQCCVPFLGICPSFSCNFHTGKSDDCMTASLLSK